MTDARKTYPVWLVFGYEDKDRIPAFLEERAAHDFVESFPTKMALRMTVVGPYHSPLELNEERELVPVERWESAMRSIVTILLGPAKSFNLDEVVDLVRQMKEKKKP